MNSNYDEKFVQRDELRHCSVPSQEELLKAQKQNAEDHNMAVKAEALYSAFPVPTNRYV